MNVPEVSKDEVMQHMRERAQMFNDVAESLAMNTDACVMTLQNMGGPTPSDAAARACVRLFCTMLENMAEDLREMADKAESGELKVAVVPLSEVHDGDSTKH